MTDIRRIGIVNRGEPAVRFLRTLRDYNHDRGTKIEAVALYTEPDRSAPFVRGADAAVSLGAALRKRPDGAMASAYTDHERVIAALEGAGCDAVWPGWGFVSEDADFVEKLEGRGILFIGPPSEAMRRLGDKIAAKWLADEAQVPMAPWCEVTAALGDAGLLAEAERIGFPLVVKASNGGGGRGIRVVERRSALLRAVAAVRDEAARSFGAGGIFIEACVSSARHIEIQLVVGADGRGASLGLRDCSLQRKHQKVIEEAPSPVVGGALATRLEEAAVRLGEGVGYRGVGTVEFLVDPSRDFAHFLEVNTRLQVEHTVTESIAGVDLVEVQLDIARGLPWRRPTWPARGHAIEVRLNAEDPERDFQPSPGVVRVFKAPMGPGIRVDSGVAEGLAIAPEFDSMIAKVIAWGQDRGQARARLARALRELEIVVEDGATNKAFLANLLEDEAYIDASADTGYLDRRQKAKDEEKGAVRGSFEALCAAAILARRRIVGGAIEVFFADVQGGIPYRFMGAPAPVELALRGGTWTFEVYVTAPARYLVGVDGVWLEAGFDATGERSAVLTLDGVEHPILYSEGKTGIAVELDGQAHRIELAAGGRVAAPAPALVVAVHVAEGDTVAVGDRLCTLEAMKMEVPVLAREAGVIRTVACRANAQVLAGQTLFVLEGDGEATTRGAGVERASVVRPMSYLFADGGADPGVTDHLDEAAARAVVADVAAVVRARLLGWELPSVLAAQADEVLAAEARFRRLRRPERWRPLAELVALFSDVEQVFMRDLALGGSGGPQKAERAFYDHCRHRGRKEAPAELKPYLGPALAHYGVDVEATGAAAEEALWRLAVAHADAERQRVTNGLLRVLMALHSAGDGFEDLRELPLTLARTAEAARADYPMLRDNAQQARYLMFRRPRAEAPLRARPLGAELGAPGGAAVEPQLEALLRRIYGAEASMGPVSSTILGVGCRAVVGESGVRSLAALVPVALVPAAVRALGPAMRELALGGRFEVHVVLAGGETSEARAAAVLAALPRVAEVTRVAVTWTEDGVAARHRSWIPAAGSAAGFEEETRFLGVHPERARRLELWRLDGFELERLDAADPVLVYRVRARANAKDERIVAYAEVGVVPAIDDGGFAPGSDRREFDWVLAECLRVVREAQAQRDARRRYYLNRIILHFEQPLTATAKGLAAVARRFEGPTRGLGLQKVTVQARVWRDGVLERRVLSFAKRGRHRLEVHEGTPSCAPMRAATEYQVRAEQCRRLGVIYPYEIVRSLEGTAGADAAMTPHPDMANGKFVELDLDASGARLVAVQRPFGENVAGVVCGLVTHATTKQPEGMTRVWLGSDPTKAMGALSEPECRRVMAALDLAAELRVPVEWLPVSAGALIAMDSGTENLDWTARVLRRIVTFTAGGGEINVIVAGVNVGAQSYWNAEATMLMHTRGVLIMTADGSMVLTGKKALEVSGSVAAEDERGIGGYERIMGPNGQAQFSARNLGDAYRLLFEHYAYTYVVPGERGVRRRVTADPVGRSVLTSPYRAASGETFETVGEIFSAETNPGRKKPFAIREVMQAVVDADGGVLERYADMEGAETALVWDAHVGGHAACVVGFEGRSLVRRGAVPLDGSEAWTAGTLFPMGSKKVARALRQASGNRPVVCLANLSGFDGSPESMRRLQLELGAEIGRAVVEFEGSMVFVVVSRYHGGAYVVFSKALNEGLVALAVEGSFASVIGGAPAAAVVFPRDVQRRAERDPRMQALRDAIEGAPRTAREGLVAELEVLRAELVLEHQGVVAREFDAVHTVQRAVAVGSLDAVVAPAELRPAIVRVLDEAAERAAGGASRRRGERSPVAAG